MLIFKLKEACYFIVAHLIILHSLLHKIIDRHLVIYYIVRISIVAFAWNIIVVPLISMGILSVSTCLCFIKMTVSLKKRVI